MAKQLSEGDIGPNDFLEYLNSYSDFSFELRTLSMIAAHGLAYEHGGNYEDPVTKKAREFDIRAVMRKGAYAVHLAVECKNIGANFPLLVSRVPRLQQESYHEVTMSSELEKEILHSIAAMTPGARVARLKGALSSYKPFTPVGKSLAQIGRSKDKDGTLVASDSEVYDKWAQCLSSADDLVGRCFSDERPESVTWLFSTVIPIVVVPDGRLWVVEYESDGKRKSDPTPCDHCSVYVDKSYVANNIAGEYFSISHLEMMTSSGLSKFIKDCLINEAAMAGIFPINAIQGIIAEQIQDEENT